MKKMKMIMAVICIFMMIGCGKQLENTKEAYQMISMEEAKKIMDEEDNIVILDVRTQEEYESGHIPGAICVPNENIGEEAIVELPNKDQKILLYCRSGNRSKQAAGKLAKAGYTNILEFGGIIDWDGEIEQ